MHLPNVYGPGVSFGFSAYEGPSGYKDDFVGFFTADRLGVAFELKARRTLAFELERGVREINYTLVVNDTFTADLLKNGESGKLDFAMVEHKALAGFARFAKPVVLVESSGTVSERDGCRISQGPGGATALLCEDRDGGTRFAFAYDPLSVEAAIARARDALKTDLDALIQKRVAFFKSLPPCPAGSPLVKRAYYKAFAVLKHNIRSPEGLLKGIWTTPDRLPHRNMWLWDSVFHSFGLRWLDENLAARAVEAVLEQQREDGFIPHMMTPTEHSDITQPPLLAWAIHESYSRTGDKDFIRRNLPRLRAYLEWDLKNRDTNHNLLCEWFIEGDPRCRSGESGMDNSQRFDKAALMDAVDFSCFMKNEYDCMAAMAAALDLGGEAEAYRKTATQIAEGVNKFLWNEKLGFYTDRYMDGTLSDVMAVSGFLPLWAGIAGPEQAKKLAAHLLDPKTFGTALPVPSASAADPEYSTDMWRGSVWLNFNYMVILGLKRYGMETLARDLAKKSVDAIARWYGQCGAIYEYYHAENLYPPQSLDRKGATTPPVDIRRKIFPIADYGWTAAVYIALLQQGYYLD